MATDPAVHVAAPDRLIEEHARALIRTVLNDEAGLARMVKNMVGHTVSEYRGRFLLELIQNGYDAHPASATDGRVAIHFDDAEGEHGVLYVANGGEGLTLSNFVRMSSLADSDKAIGAGVGNKGVGFKSVFQVCDVPEVYSAASALDPGFGGFSFRFGTFDDLVRHLDGDRDAAEAVAEQLSLSLLTVPLLDVPQAVADLREAGYATVIRLPARSPRARDLIEEKIADLLGTDSPVMLFLERLELLSVRRDATSGPTVLERHQVPAGSGHSAHSVVTLDGSDTYKLFKAQVPPDRLREALQESVDMGALDKRWLEWDAAAYVSVAIGDDHLVDSGAAYTYLPMGAGAKSPLSGHVNAPFVTNFARVGLDHEQPVNQLMLGQIAELCLRVGAAIEVADGDAQVVADMLVWDEHLDTLLTTCERVTGEPLTSRLRLPVLGGDWTSIAAVRVWPSASTTIIDAASVAAASSARILDGERLDPRRVATLVKFADGLGVDVVPREEQLADWAETLAASLVAEATTSDTWARFYDDLPVLFRLGSALQGRKIVLSVDGTLVPCNQPAEVEAGGSRQRRRSRSVFFQPRRTTDSSGDDEEPDDDTLATAGSDAADGDQAPDFRPPRSLSSRLTLVHPDLVWREGAQRTAGREFLESKHLVQPFRTGGLLALLGRVMKSATSDNVKRDSLEYAFRLFAREPERHERELAAVGLHVPTKAGVWIEATTARFGDPWNVAGAADLGTVAAAASDATPELQALASVLLAEPASFRAVVATADEDTVVQAGSAQADSAAAAGDQATTGRWEKFLQTIGVTATLPINSVSDSRELMGRGLRDTVLAAWKVPSGLPEAVARQWFAVVPATGYEAKPETYFQTTDALYWLSGQGEVSSLPKRDRDAYARCVVRTMRVLKSEHWTSTWRRKSRGGFPWEIPTPLSGFVRAAAWIPVSKPEESLKFESPDDAWYVRPGEEMAANYSPVVEPSLRRLIDRTGFLPLMVERTGLRIWGSRKDSAVLIDHLTDLLGSRELSDAGSEHLRASLSKAWGEVGDPTFPDVPHMQNGLIVDRAGRMELVATAEAGRERIFVMGSGDRSTTARLIRDIGWPVIAVDTVDVGRLREIASAVITPHWGDDVVVADDWKIELLVDDVAWEPSPSGTRLVAEVPWLPLIIACTMRFPRSGGSGVGRNLERHLEALEAVQIVRCSRIAIETASGAQGLPARLRGVLTVPGSTPTLLVEGMHDPFTWEELGTVSEAALELIGQSRYVADLALTVSRLAAEPTNAVHEPDLTEIADVIDQPLVRVQETEARVYGSVAGLLQRILPSVVHLWGPSLTARLDKEVPSTRDDLLALLTEASEGDSSTVADLLEHGARALDADTVRRNMGIALSGYNETLARHFPGARLIDNSESHLEVFAVRRSQRRVEILDWMRAANLAAFRSGRVPDDWAQMRELGFLQADPAWGTSVDDLTVELMDVHIDSVLSSAFGNLRSDPGLGRWDEVRQVNNIDVRRRLEELEKLARAWHRKHAGHSEAGETVEGGGENGGEPDPAEPAGPAPVVTVTALGPPEDFVPDSMRVLDAGGALDFVPLDADLLVKWLVRLDLWPQPMPQAVTADALGLSEEDLTEATAERDGARAARLRAERQVILHGEALEVDLAFENLVEKVSHLLATDPPSLDTRFATTQLRTLAPSSSSGRRGSGKRASNPTGPRKRMTDAQRNSVGLTGELIAFHWLRKKERSPVDETCWKSSYVSFVFPGAVGDDDLGYDFAVPRAEGQVFYEVKATSGEEAAMIELGESEVARAQEFSRGRKADRWRLLVVEDAMSTEPRVLMLPNPFAPQSRGLYRFVGNGVRLRFSQ